MNISNLRRNDDPSSSFESSSACRLSVQIVNGVLRKMLEVGGGGGVVGHNRMVSRSLLSTTLGLQGTSPVCQKLNLMEEDLNVSCLIDLIAAKNSILLKS